MKLYCADCMDILKGIPEGSIDMILCDLPYGTTRNKWDVIIPQPDKGGTRQWEAWQPKETARS